MEGKRHVAYVIVFVSHGSFVSTSTTIILVLLHSLPAHSPWHRRTMNSIGDHRMSRLFRIPRPYNAGIQNWHGAYGLAGRAHHERRYNPSAGHESPPAGAQLGSSLSQAYHLPYQFDKSLADTIVRQVKTKTTLKVSAVLRFASFSIHRDTGPSEDLPPM